ncbi:hypothetical protein M0805_001963 [Coniferiporia weirii]|nr:hypothetical protein M0805_001963 [Coniferiporia weirii]
MTVAEMYLALTNHIVNVTEGLSKIFESSFSVFLGKREKALSIDYNNMLTAATFFSAVTATTLQLSYAYNTSIRVSLGVAVNTLWFVALVFSTASSLNSLVGLMWYQNYARAQDTADPFCAGLGEAGVEYGPTIPLAVASAAFSAGLCLFAFSSSQHTITSALTATFTVAHAVALFVPLCLYSPNRISRFFLKVLSLRFGYLCYLCRRWWYLRRVPRQDWDNVVLGLYSGGMSWSKRNIQRIQRELEEERAHKRESGSGTGPSAASSSTGDASPESSSSLIGVEGNTEMDLMFVRLSAYSVVAWLVTRWLTLYPRRTRVTHDSSDKGRADDPDEKVARLSKLEFDIESRGDAGKSDMQKPVVTDSQGPAPLQGPPASTSDANDSDEGAGFTAKGPSEEVGRSFDAPSAPGSKKEHIVTTSSMADFKR